MGHCPVCMKLLGTHFFASQNGTNVLYLYKTDQSDPGTTFLLASPGTSVQYFVNVSLGNVPSWGSHLPEPLGWVGNILLLGRALTVSVIRIYPSPRV